MLSPYLLLLPLLLGHAAPGAPPVQGGLIADIEDWTEAFSRRKRASSEESLEQIRLFLIDLRGFGRTSSGHRVQGSDLPRVSIRPE